MCVCVCVRERDFDTLECSTVILQVFYITHNERPYTDWTGNIFATHVGLGLTTAGE